MVWCLPSTVPSRDARPKWSPRHAPPPRLQNRTGRLRLRLAGAPGFPFAGRSFGGGAGDPRGALWVAVAAGVSRHGGGTRGGDGQPPGRLHARRDRDYRGQLGGLCHVRGRLAPQIPGSRRGHHSGDCPPLAVAADAFPAADDFPLPNRRSDTYGWRDRGRRAGRLPDYKRESTGQGGPNLQCSDGVCRLSGAAGLRPVDDVVSLDCRRPPNVIAGVLGLLPRQRMALGRNRLASRASHRHTLRILWIFLAEHLVSHRSRWKSDHTVHPRSGAERDRLHRHRRRRLRPFDRLSRADVAAAAGA